MNGTTVILTHLNGTAFTVTANSTQGGAVIQSQSVQEITGFAPAPIDYTATGGAFLDGATNDGVLLKGSSLGGDTFNVQSTLAGSTTFIQGGNGSVTFNVASPIPRPQPATAARWAADQRIPTCSRSSAP